MIHNVKVAMLTTLPAGNLQFSGMKTSSHWKHSLLNRTNQDREVEYLDESLRVSLGRTLEEASLQAAHSPLAHRLGCRSWWQWWVTLSVSLCLSVYLSVPGPGAECASLALSLAPTQLPLLPSSSPPFLLSLSPLPGSLPSSVCLSLSVCLPSCLPVCLPVCLSVCLTLSQITITSAQ